MDSGVCKGIQFPETWAAARLRARVRLRTGVQGDAHRLALLAEEVTQVDLAVQEDQVVIPGEHEHLNGEPALGGHPVLLHVDGGVELTWAAGGAEARVSLLNPQGPEALDRSWTASSVKTAPERVTEARTLHPAPRLPPCGFPGRGPQAPVGRVWEHRSGGGGPVSRFGPTLPAHRSRAGPGAHVSPPAFRG